MGVESEERCTMTIAIILSATVISDRDDTGCQCACAVRVSMAGLCLFNF